MNKLLSPIFIFSIFFAYDINLVYSQDQTSNLNQIHGKWKGEDTVGNDLVIIFRTDKTIDFRSGEHSAFENEKGNKKIKAEFQAVFEVVPHQLYIKIIENGKVKSKWPFGIFKINGSKLLIRESKEFVRTLGGFEIGKRYELPTDFNGPLMIFQKVK